MPARELHHFLGLSDPFSALSHGLVGVFLLLAGLWLVPRGGEDRARRAALWVYVLGVGGLFLTSATYHSLPATHSLKGLFWRLDHVAVWIAITATMVPVQVLLCGPESARRRLTAIGCVALVGAITEAVFLDSLPPWISPLLYVGMGWVCAPVLVEVTRLHGAKVAAPMWAGGVAATLGGFVDALDAPALVVGTFEAHELLHVAIVVGWLCYWWRIWGYASGHDGYALGHDAREGAPAVVPERVSVLDSSPV